MTNDYKVTIKEISANGKPYLRITYMRKNTERKRSQFGTVKGLENFIKTHKSGELIKAINDFIAQNPNHLYSLHSDLKISIKKLFNAIEQNQPCEIFLEEIKNSINSFKIKKNQRCF